MRDIELACDEKVIRTMGSGCKKDYSQALVNCSIPRSTVAACPLAFGEGRIKGRIKAVLAYRKPARWIIAAAAVLILLLAVCFLTNPAGTTLQELDDCGDYQDLLCSAERLDIVYQGQCTSTEDPQRIARIAEILQTLRISKTPLSQDRSEDRDKTNRIVSGDGTAVCFDADFTAVWIDNGVKPTLSYEVLDPDGARSAFRLNTVQVGEDRYLSVLGSGSDIPGVHIAVTGGDLDAQQPYLQILWTNETDGEIVFGISFDILHDSGGDWVSCARQELIFNALAYLLPARQTRSENYYVSSFRLKDGITCRFRVEQEPGKYLWIDFQLSSAAPAVSGQGMLSADLDQDGIPEQLSIQESQGESYELLVTNAQGGVIWSEHLDTFHSGWRALFLCSTGDQDALLVYNPAMYQGICSYEFQLYRLENGQAVTLDSGRLQFDINGREPLPVEQMTAFAEQVNGYLADSILLCSTLNGTAVTGPAPADSYLETYSWLYADGRSSLYRETDTLAEKLRAYSDYMTQYYQNS